MKKIILLIGILPGLLFAKKGTEEVGPEAVAPWFTGPLICPAANTVVGGSYNIESYLYTTKIPTQYNNDWTAEPVPSQWSLQLQPLIWAGINDWMDIEFFPSLIWNHAENGGGGWAQGDLGVQLDFQLFRDDLPHKTWLPTIKLALRETLPVGKYRNLNPKKYLADQGGFGTWSTTIQLVFGRIFYFSDFRFLNLRLNIQSNIYNTPVHVKGYSIYGGGVGANGTVRPGQTLTLDLAAEYSLTRHWALALDMIGYWEGRCKFDGNPGKNFFTGQTAIAGKPACAQFSLAPAVEYNWNENLGAIGGVWFTFAGKQIPSFYSFIFAVIYYK